jgi:hypothetical protein
LKTHIIAEMESQLEEVTSKRSQFEHEKTSSLARDTEMENLIVKLQNCKVARRTSQYSRQAGFNRFRRQPETESAKRDQEEESSQRTIIAIRNRNSTNLLDLSTEISA